MPKEISVGSKNRWPFAADHMSSMIEYASLRANYEDGRTRHAAPASPMNWATSKTRGRKPLIRCEAMLGNERPF
jgi:hypothetical protein